VSEDWKQIADEAWRAPSWREAAVKYHEARPDSSPRVAPPRNRWAPEATVEALMFSLRRGVGALNDPKTDNQRRLSELSEQQLREVCERLQNFKPNIAPAWPSEDVQKLVHIWRRIRA
jgi:hypothetical protein